MGVAVVSRVVCVLGLLVLLCCPAYAGEFQDDLDAARELVGRRRYNEAVAAFQKLFDEYERDARLVAAREGIERDLQICLFGIGRPKVSGEELFGPAVVSFSASNRKVKLLFDTGTADDAWIGGETRILPVRFDDVTVTSPADPKAAAKADHGPQIVGVSLLSYNPESEGGYRLVAGVDHSIELLEGDGTKTLDRDDSPLKRKRKGESRWVRFTRRGLELRVEQHGCNKLTAHDSTHRAGFVALALFQLWGTKIVEKSPSVLIEGRIEETWLDQRMAELEHAAFQKWKAEEYDPHEVLPPWLAGAELEYATEELPAPPDVSDAARPHVERFMEALLTGDGSIRFDAAVVANAALRGEGFVAALQQFSRGRTAEAERGLAEYVGKDHEFHWARLWLAMVQLHRRRLDAATDTLDAASETMGSTPLFHELRARARLLTGDLDGAHEALQAAQSAGAWTEDLAALTRSVDAARRGPQWKRTYNRRSTNFEVFSDHSADLCGEVAKILQDSTRRFVRTFRPLPDERFPTRVYVFSGLRGYLEFAAELGVDLRNSAGAYLPRQHIMVVWLPLDRRDFEATVRHEAFHQYVHHFAERLPHWFNEGWAEYYGNESRADTVKVHATDRVAMSEGYQRLSRDFSSLMELLTMPGGQFMQNAAAHYVQSWMVVTALAESDEPELRGALTAYFDSLVQGESADDAYETHLKGLHTEIQHALRELKEELAELR